MREQILLHSSTVVSNGASRTMRTDSALLTAYLSAAGGTATCSVWGRAVAGSPWKLLWEASLSGVDAHEEYLLDGELWYDLQGRITAVAGGAKPTIAAGA